MFSHPTPGTPIETSVISNDFYADFRRLVTDVNVVKERNQTLQNHMDQLERERTTSAQKMINQQKQIDLQKDQLTESKMDVERLKKELERSIQMIEQQSQVISQQKSQLDHQNEMIAGLTTSIENIKNESGEARTSVKQLQNQINSAQSSQQNQISSLSSQLSQISNELRQQIQQTNSSISSTTSTLRTQIDAVRTRVNDDCLRKGVGYNLQNDMSVLFVQMMLVSADDGVIWITGKAENHSILRGMKWSVWMKAEQRISSEVLDDGDMRGEETGRKCRAEEADGSQRIERKKFVLIHPAKQRRRPEQTFPEWMGQISVDERTEILPTILAGEMEASGGGGYQHSLAWSEEAGVGVLKSAELMAEEGAMDEERVMDQHCSQKADTTRSKTTSSSHSLSSREDCPDFTEIVTIHRFIDGWPEIEEQCKSGGEGEGEVVDHRARLATENVNHSTKRKHEAMPEPTMISHKQRLLSKRSQKLCETFVGSC
ncbi:hypothetical protein BLNAU_8406 [Blattamonas nauphoetae]|uniref:Uncharacterized protein n=1 Tax=Blattamonas nauphoetae TaxID=2049346 RepID=A0ABQ9XYJ3_9EUKA|nr:hypothetical protein BLNAU_8406 [Blattamonas nauphoetae]